MSALSATCVKGWAASVEWLMFSSACKPAKVWACETIRGLCVWMFTVVVTRAHSCANMAPSLPSRKKKNPSGRSWKKSWRRITARSPKLRPNWPKISYELWRSRERSTRSVWSWSRTVRSSRRRSRKSSWARASPGPSSPSRSKPPTDTPHPQTRPTNPTNQRDAPCLHNPLPPALLLRGSHASFLEVLSSKNPSPKKEKGRKKKKPTLRRRTFAHRSGFISFLGMNFFSDVECLSGFILSLNKKNCALFFFFLCVHTQQNYEIVPYSGFGKFSNLF